MFVNNEKTLLKIYEALFPHRTANILGHELPQATQGSSLATGINMGYSKDHESSHFRNKTTTIKLSAIKTSDAMGANGPFLPTTSNTANAQ